MKYLNFPAKKIILQFEIFEFSRQKFYNLKYLNFFVYLFFNRQNSNPENEIFFRNFQTLCLFAIKNSPFQRLFDPFRFVLDE